MYRVIHVPVLLGGLVLLALVAADPAVMTLGPTVLAASHAGPPCIVDANLGIGLCIAKHKPRGGGSGQGRGAGKGAAGGAGSGGGAGDPACAPTLLTPQPPLSDPAWGGHTSGAVYAEPLCKNGRVVSWLPTWVWLGQGPAVVRATPAQLASQAMAEVRIPRPALSLSPGQSNSDAGVRYTWVNLPTWYWTASASWRVVSKKATDGPVWAQVTLTPVDLTFDPGDGNAATSCGGPGRAWTAADGNDAPSRGGCVYRYVSVSDGVTPALSIRWQASWTGSGGTGGDLDGVTTTTTSPRMKVEQIQVVNR